MNNIETFKQILHTIYDPNGFLYHRNYDFNNRYKSLSDAEILALLNQDSFHIETIHNKTISKLYIIFDLLLKRKSVEQYIEEKLDVTENTHIIIIHNRTKKVNLDKLYNLYPNIIELFYYKNLIFNIMNHKHVPLHYKVDKDIPELKSYNIKDLPKIKKKDPVIKFLGYNVGDIVCIKREISKVYREVIL
tara:strand:- start:448 stop:1017 length:570 start_codon:yes stop_codon:yes gene_type:complete